MGRNDRLDDWEHTDLPPEAIDESSSILEINEDWLKDATPDQQREAMKAWFLARYCDPANDTPYISEEGGYIYIHGGPYDPQEEIGSRFQGILEDRIINEVVGEFYSQVGPDWAPVHWGRDYEEYDEDFGIVVEEPSTPRLALHRRLEEISELLSLDGPDTAMALARMFAYSGTITALESFLWETMTYAVENDERALEEIIKNINHFKDQNLKLGEIFDKQKALKGLVKGYLQDTVWHKWNTVGPIIVHGLQVKPPSFKPFVAPVRKRHDIVHRSGQTKDGSPITVEVEEITALMDEVRNFATNLHAEMAKKFFRGDDESDF